MTEPIASPCVRNCCLDEKDVCLGCYRSLDEILQWQQSSNDQKSKVLENARKRRRAHNLRYRSFKQQDDDRPDPSFLG